MAPNALPDGEGVIDRKAPAGKVIALYSALFILGAAAILGLQSLVNHDAHAATARPSASIEQTVQGIASDVHDIKAEQSNQSRDIAVIKRQLGLDGLGPPPIHTSGVGR